tara:strand:- start:105 stop:524 length:420 start_codon:yes stop_codon:yes gene_type:complete
MTFHPHQMDVIDRRQVEALILGPMLIAFQSEIGVEKTNEIARTVITSLAREQGAQFVQDIGSNRLEDYASNKDAWRRNGALEIEVIHSDNQEYSFKVTRCKYAEMYNELGYPDLGEIFWCTRDFEFCSGFNSGIELRRK